jgi:RNA polymerase sigma-70 factor (ECF subfamily)
MLGVLSKRPDGFAVQARVINGQLAFIGYNNSQPYSIQTMEVDNGQIRRIFIILNPEKLRGVPPL